MLFFELSWVYTSCLDFAADISPVSQDSDLSFSKSQVFEPFGTVELVQLPPDLETGHSSRYGFVQVILVLDMSCHNI